MWGPGWNSAWWGWNTGWGWWGWNAGWGWNGWWGPGWNGWWGTPAWSAGWNWPAVAVTTPIVVEQEATAFVSPAPAPTTLWYYCTEPPGYFPYVQSCNRAWIPVVPQASPAG